MNWLNEWEQTLRRLYAQGLSQSAISKEVGRTRNAVAGKIYRLGLHRDDQPKRGRPKVASIPWLARLARERAAKEPEFPKGPHKPRKPVTFAGLQPHHCRQPFGEGSKMTFCANDRQAGSSYCPHHHRINHCTPRSKPRSA